MRVVTVAQMKQIEKLADANGVSYYQMMENAGTAAYHILRQRVPHAKHIAVVAGKGNNGGDGFVMARFRHSARSHLTRTSRYILHWQQRRFAVPLCWRISAYRILVIRMRNQRHPARV